ncbi:MAG: HD domain-containing protein, partial [Candidatus Syntrophonatronum acetioxidans]
MERINRILENKYFQEYLQNIYRWEVNRKFCCHDFEHSLAVARIAYLISLEKGKIWPQDIIYAAAFLHDIGRWQEYEGGRDHAEASAELAEG